MKQSAKSLLLRAEKLAGEKLWEEVVRGEPGRKEHTKDNGNGNGNGNGFKLLAYIGDAAWAYALSIWAFQKMQKLGWTKARYMIHSTKLREGNFQQRAAEVIGLQKKVNGKHEERIREDRFTKQSPPDCGEVMEALIGAMVLSNADDAEALRWITNLLELLDTAGEIEKYLA